MSDTVTTFPQLSPIAFNDWLPKLGEKAFLAWLQFHSWMNEIPLAESNHLLSLSFNQVIKRLQVGKSTFFQKILQPLKQYGLIKPKPTGKSRNETHLYIYPYPHNLPENAARCLQAAPIEVETSGESQVVLESDPHVHSPLEDKEQDLENAMLPPQSELNLHSLPPTKSSDQILSLNSLPAPLQQTIQKDPRLLERSIGIIKTYHELKHHPRFQLQEFQQKMLTCIEYPHSAERFGPYLLKSLKNHWNQSKAVSRSPARKDERVHTPDLPEWIVRQEQQKNSPPEPEEITPEQKAEIDRLLKALGDL